MPRTSRVCSVLALILPLVSAIIFQPARASAQIRAVWANEGGDKVTRDELRATNNPASVSNSVWDGAGVRLFGARNEVLSANFVIEAGSAGASGLSVSMSSLSGPGGFTLGAPLASRSNLYDWRGRRIETFFVRYLQIKGLSINASDHYDERHVPERMRRRGYDPDDGRASGSWADRPDHDKYYPEIAVPMELVPSFDVPALQNQSIWVDIYIPKAAPAGQYTGSFSVLSGGSPARNVPVTLTVRNFALPDTPDSKTMLVITPGEINLRYFGNTYVNPLGSQGPASIRVRDNHFRVAHRHKISLISDNYEHVGDEPSPEWIRRLDGSLFTPVNGYDGPGEGVGNGVFAIGLYGGWGWRGQDRAAMWRHTDAWESWFNANSPQTERFLYLIDESHDYPQIEEWSRWIIENPGPGRSLMSFSTLDLLIAQSRTPSLSIAATTSQVGHTPAWQSAADRRLSDPGRRLWFYNGKRPGSGSFAIEDDGVSLRELPWGQYRTRVQRWFFWESTYYRNYNQGLSATNVFQQAQTFGSSAYWDSSSSGYGMTAPDGYSNGDGVLFYPGTDLAFPAENIYRIDGPLASLRLKHWRRGIQDVDYVKLAASYDPAAAAAIVDQIVPRALWEYGADDPNEPTWKRTDISWSNDPDVWEAARQSLADIIESRNGAPTPTPTATPTRAPTTVPTPVSSAAAAPTRAHTRTPTRAPTRTATATPPGRVATLPPSATVAAESLPETPAALSAFIAPDGALQVSWIDRSSNESGFSIERSRDNGPFALLGEAPANATSYRMSGAVPGAHYLFRVRSFNASGASPFSESAAVSVPSARAALPPDAPRDLLAALSGPGEARLTWTDASQDEDGFVIERSADGGAFLELAVVAGGTVQYVSRNMRGGVSYSFRVRAYNGAGSSGYSNASGVSVPVIVSATPRAPSALRARRLSTRRLSLSWRDGADNEVGYLVERSRDGRRYRRIARLAPDSTSFAGEIMRRGRSYFFRVGAVGQDGAAAYGRHALVRWDRRIVCGLRRECARAN